MNSTLSLPYQRLAALGLSLPPVPTPIGRFVNTVEVGPLLYLSGQGPLDAEGHLHTGKVGRDVSVAAAYEHARLTGLNLLSVLHGAVGDLGRVQRIVKLLGFVNAVEDFTEHPAVINGCSDLLCEVFGNIGFHARSAIGVGSLPNNISVEVEAIFQCAP
ncbi:MAG: RidA family protein [Acuticoccus sp.]